MGEVDQQRMHAFVINEVLWRACLWEKLTDDGCMHLSSTRYSDEIRFGTDTLHSDNDMMTRVAQPFNKDLMAHWLDTPMLQSLNATTQGLDESMACGRSNGVTIQADVLDMIQESWHRRPDNAIDECYDDEVLEKATMQIRR